MNQYYKGAMETKLWCWQEISLMVINHLINYLDLPDVTEDVS